MRRHRADRLVGALLAAILLAGAYSAWRAYDRARALDRMMGSMMGGGPMGTGNAPFWLALGTVVAVVVIGTAYLSVRETLTEPPRSARAPPASADGGADGGGSGTEGPVAGVEAGRPRARVLDILPDDERRVLEPVIESPGITQIELRDRSAFSKSKVSQTVSSLEKRGLLYRERQGRTYRVYPDDSLRERLSG